MKKVVFVVLTFMMSVGLLSAQQARIKIDVDRTIGEIDPNLYGNFVEHLGRCVYGGIYEPGSSLSDENGFRKDVMQAVKDLKVPLTRYPGGNFVSNYHWLDAVGPERVPRMDYAWQRLETNKFGTNEFVTWAKKVGTEPYFAVNLGTGTIEEAQWWVEYCNADGGSYYSELRKKHGYPEPHNIKYWGLGNEMDGPWQMGHLNAEDYVKKAREAAKLMKMVSPDIKLIAAGSSHYSREANPDYWNRTILEGLGEQIDYIALHMYVGNLNDNYYNFISTPMVMDSRTQVVRGMIYEQVQRMSRPKPIYIAWDEYNVWYRARTGKDAVGERALEEHYNLEDALVVAGFLNVFVRNADIVKMANMAQLVNVIAPIFTSEQGMFLQTIYYPLQLFANHMKGTSLDVLVDCETYNTQQFDNGMNERSSQQSNVPYLDVSAAVDGDEITICVVNRHKDKAISTDVLCQEGSFNGSFEVYEVNGPDIKSMNDFGKTLVETKKKSDIKAKADKFTYSFAPHSFTMIKGKVKK
ncbi:alpha-N-arabinofuranosidase [Parabacteroides sp. PFB2-10]|uniref:alpha-N-arabinofuranosidase n=1 Tax=Parabacteroides sp. PFB2-10 TaxID=1742405 RepID=UPI0024753D9C|nr:alpha-L-arabinofuranosidase C-terminal domain-containing protein [Parabacteroides sp. PFB2-10]MDH6311990.1 alpha-N-arabinofuranosidase [Parabacteroides sp. PFB2-10]MDL2245030.1 alpha-N-arabinofuranosidase [Parabacteroides sp. OttesenSCG-928-J18]